MVCRHRTGSKQDQPVDGQGQYAAEYQPAECVMWFLNDIGENLLIVAIGAWRPVVIAGTTTNSSWEVPGDEGSLSQLCADGEGVRFGVV
jgi:hypothetical protein